MKSLPLFAVSILCLLAMLSAGASALNFTGWKYYSEVSFQNTSHINEPIIVATNGIGGVLSQCVGDCDEGLADVRVVDMTTDTLLPFELLNDSYETPTYPYQTTKLQFIVPDASHTIRIYYGNQGAWNDPKYSQVFNYTFVFDNSLQGFTEASGGNVEFYIGKCVLVITPQMCYQYHDPNDCMNWEMGGDWVAMCWGISDYPDICSLEPSVCVDTTGTTLTLDGNDFINDGNGNYSAKMNNEGNGLNELGNHPSGKYVSVLLKDEGEDIPDAPHTIVYLGLRDSISNHFNQLGRSLYYLQEGRGSVYDLWVSGEGYSNPQPSGVSVLPVRWIPVKLAYRWGEGFDYYVDNQWVGDLNESYTPNGIDTLYLVSNGGYGWGDFWVDNIRSSDYDFNQYVQPNIPSLTQYEIQVECVPDWNCNGWGACVNGSQPCNSVSDLNLCGQEYTGNYSEFEPEPCGTPTGYASNFEVADIPKITIDTIGEGLLVVLSLVGVVVLVNIGIYLMDKIRGRLGK